MPTVAVLLAVYNGEQYLREQVESIMSQSNVEVSLFAYDDCSTDDSWHLLQNLRTEFPRITLVKNSAPSGSAFNNFYHAIRSFSTQDFEYIALSDQDDIWRKEKLSRQIDLMRLTDSDGSSTSVQTFGTHGKSAYINNAGKQSSIDFLFTGGGQGCTYLLSNRLFLTVKSLIVRLQPSSVPHDWFIYAVSRILGYRWSIMQEPLLDYRQHQNVFGSRNSIKGVQFRLKMLCSKEFLSDRLMLIGYLQNIAIDKSPDDLTVILLSQKSFWKRAQFALTHLFYFRRFKLQSLAIAMFFVAGLA